MCFFGVSTLRNYIWGVIPQKLPQFFAGIGIPSLNVQSNNSRTARPILVIRSSNDAAPQKAFKYVGQTAKICFLGVNTKTLHQREFPSQNTPIYNFLTTQPIHTNSNSIDAARQVEHHAKLKYVKNFTLGEQFQRKFPQREFPSQNRNVLITFEWMEIDEKSQWNTYRKSGPRNRTVT
jgi:hypothetical protein